MRVINTKSDEVIALTHAKKKIDGISIHKTYIYLSKSLCLTFGIREGQYVQFMNDGSVWDFFVNNDSDGFILLKDGKKNGALCIYNSGVCHMIRKSTGIEENVFCSVKATLKEINGSMLYRINTQKPIEL